MKVIHDNRFAHVFNVEVGDLLYALRERAGLSHDDVARALALSRLEKIKRLEAGAESVNGRDLLELIALYGADPLEIDSVIRDAALKARSYLVSTQPQ